MKKFSELIVKSKWIIISIFMLLSIGCCIGSSFVNINYNISDYLNEKTDTKIAIEIIEEEFGMTGDLQVMLDGIDKNTAKQVEKDIKEIENVINVNFDAEDETFYKDNKALYVIIIDGDDYSTVAENVTFEIKELIESKYNSDAEYGGTTIEKQNLKNGITNEIKYILIIAISLVIIILLITSRSWLEPVVLLAVSGIAILINNGTNFFFGEISYITNSISAILQLALSIDYSIVLIHTYRKYQKEGLNNNEAMEKAILECIRPVSASGLTTIAGLLALVFMSFTIGFDIGIVLMKGICISVVTSLTLLPCILIITDKLLIKTSKKDLKLKGKKLAKISFKASKVIVPVTLIAIVSSFCVQGLMNYSFADTQLQNEKMTETFGENNSLIVVFANSDNSYEKQKEFIKKIEDYKKSNGEDILINYTAYINTVREELTIDEASKDLELSKTEAEQLFTMYHLYKNPESLKLDFNTFINSAYDLVLNDKEAIEMVDEKTKTTIIQIKTVNDVLLNSNTAIEFYATLKNVNLEGSNIESIKQLYGIYAYNSLENTSVDFKTMLDFIILSSKENEIVGSMLSENDVLSLTNLSQGIVEFSTQMELPLDKQTFQGMMYQNYQKVLTTEEVDQIYASYFVMNNLEVKDTIEYMNIMNHLVTLGMITDDATILTLKNYTMTYQAMHSNYKYDEFATALGTISYGLTGQIPQINMDNNSILQMYVMYFETIGSFNDVKIKGIDFVDFALEQYQTNPIINSQMSSEDYNKLIDMKSIYDLSIDDNKYTYDTLTKRLSDLQNNMVSIIDTEKMSSDKVSGVFIKYAMNNNLNIEDSIMAFEVLDFINENKDNNFLLKQKLTTDKLEKVDEANEDIKRAEKLFKGENYSRLLLSLDVENDSEEGTKFVEFVKSVSREVFGENTYVAGELMSTYDLKESFDYDNTLITIITIISIFIIVLLVFKSISLPIVLVTIIQGAIWITCAITVGLNMDIFFMSYIVASCILMGATIDYGILLSNSYVEFRNEFDKKQSLIKAVESALPTVFTSGLILTICGFVIGFISSQISIATVGKLIGIGTISSVIMIIFVLPSVLYLFDKFIIKLTFKR